MLYKQVFKGGLRNGREAFHDFDEVIAYLDSALVSVLRVCDAVRWDYLSGSTEGLRIKLDYRLHSVHYFEIGGFDYAQSRVLVEMLRSFESLALTESLMR